MNAIDNSNKQAPKDNTMLVNWMIVLLLTIIWGSSFFLIKKGVEHLAASQVAAARIFISFLALIPFIARHVKKIPLRHWKYVAIVGLFGSGLPPFLFAIAQTKVDSGITGIINATVPLFTLIIGVLIFRVPFVLAKLFGVLIGLLGAILLLALGGDSSGSTQLAYGALILVATFCYAISANSVKHFLQAYKPISITTIAFLLLGIPAGIYLFSTDIVHELQANPLARASLAYVAVLAVVGTAFASIVFFWLTQRTSALFASAVTYLMPIVSTAIGFYDGEYVSVYHFIGLGLILSGVYLVGRKRKKAIVREVVV